MSKIRIRKFEMNDFHFVTALWRRARWQAYPDVEQRTGYTEEDDRIFFQNKLMVDCEIWVAETEGTIAAFMAIKDDLIYDLYVDVNLQRRGIGKALLEHARQLSPTGLKLYTFQQNKNARSFYEKN